MFLSSTGAPRESFKTGNELRQQSELNEWIQPSNLSCLLFFVPPCGFLFPRNCLISLAVWLAFSVSSRFLPIKYIIRNSWDKKSPQIQSYSFWAAHYHKHPLFMYPESHGPILGRGSEEFLYLWEIWFPNSWLKSMENSPKSVFWIKRKHFPCASSAQSSVTWTILKQ